MKTRDPFIAPEDTDVYSNLRKNIDGVGTLKRGMRLHCKKFTQGFYSNQIIFPSLFSEGINMSSSSLEPFV